MANTYLTKTMGNPPGNSRIGTFSFWFKRSGLSTSDDEFLFSTYVDANNRTLCMIEDSGKLKFSAYSGGNLDLKYDTNRLFRDTNAWYNIVIATDTTQSTAANRVKIYVNGVQETSFAASTVPSQNVVPHYLYGGIVRTIGAYGNGNGAQWNGLMSYVAFIDGTQELPTVFGETDATTGEWKIKTTITPSSAFGDNGYLILKDGNSVTDQSGNSNNFTVGGGTLTNTEDCPSNVFATCSKEPIRTVSGTQVKPVLSNGNTTWDGTGVSAGASITLSTLGATTGKYYMEAKVGGSYVNHSRIGVGTFEGYDGATFFNSTSSNYVAYTYNGEKNIAGTTSSYGASYTVGDIISVALDCDNNTVTFYKNGASQGAINITNNDNFKHFSLGGYDNTGSDITNWICNFGNGYFGTTAVSSAGTNASGNGIFEYDVPSGYTALSTKGLNI